MYSVHTVLPCVLSDSAVHPLGADMECAAEVDTGTE